MSEKNDTPPIQTTEGESLSRKHQTSCWGLSAVPKTSPGLRIKLKRPHKLTVSPPITSAEDPDPVQVADSNDEPHSHSSGRSFQVDDSSDDDLEDMTTKRPCGRPPKVWMLHITPHLSQY